MCIRDSIGLSFKGDADDAWSANGTSIIGAATSISGGCSTTSYKSTLTITNKKSTTATLSFDYSIEQNGGKIQVDGTEVSSGASLDVYKRQVPIRRFSTLTTPQAATEPSHGQEKSPTRNISPAATARQTAIM